MQDISSENVQLRERIEEISGENAELRKRMENLDALFNKVKLQLNIEESGEEFEEVRPNKNEEEAKDSIEEISFELGELVEVSGHLFSSEPEWTVGIWIEIWTL